ncbi:MAG: hypothetical protein COV29_02650 [Candidatus Yanofskybacteria bacterium CG10_big_fil_rev_8_21_14_0_10_36_16]|uniref:Major facilitator superfamily (MFS) profile domain-containing protein n=1 Tax=Candidatus Yanofskybacteria bacterium CG10_big_fil_rev_8_21_14_0_10_36_16 TaxID=1975096 RepID=A0A2J0QAN1_9BACT|nr:MAG: hypothetical protein COV29_02650 [Candidatus Yanofskybacteria bacterium CG10_big_fil_rev_8_21_14_0_10_36_16]
MDKKILALKHYFLKDINFVIRLLIVSDVILVGAAGLFSPVFAIFIEDFIIGGNAAVVGVSVAVYLFTKSTLQIPLAAFIDKIKGEKDDFMFLFWGSVVMSVIPLLYLVINLPWQLYIIQFVLGFFTAMTFPSYVAIFTRHIDNHKEGTEWGVYFTLTDLSSATLAAIGGFIAISIGFNFLIISMVFFSVLGTIFLLPIKKYLRK